MNHFQADRPSRRAADGATYVGLPGTFIYRGGMASLPLRGPDCLNVRPVGTDASSPHLFLRRAAAWRLPCRRTAMHCLLYSFRVAWPGVRPEGVYGFVAASDCGCYYCSIS